MRRAVLTIVSLSLVLSIGSHALAAGPPETRSAIAEITDDGAASWATFKQIDVAEERSSNAVLVAQNGLRERTSGSPAAALTRSAQSGRPDGCYMHTLSTTNGTVRLLQICPGYGGYAGGTAAEAFGISRLTLSDPVTGEPLPAAGGGGGELIVVDPRTLAERAAAALRLPAPVVHLSPSQDQVTQLPSWLWISQSQWSPRQVAASAGPVTSTVTATPARVRWDMGNGDEVSCDGPGRPYREEFAGNPEATDCRYTYRHSSAALPGAAYQLTATIDWQLTWNATGAPGGGGLGVVPMSSTQPVRVSEVQALVQ